MKKLVLLIVLFTLLSCNVDHVNFVGKWVGKKYEKEIVNIEKNGKNYLVKLNDKIYPAQVKDELLEISMQMPIKATIDNNDILIIAGNEYIRIEKSKKPDFKGLWKQNLPDDIQERDYCSYLFLDLKIDIDENNDFVINGGYIENNNFNQDSNINFSYNQIRFKDGKITGKYKYFLNPDIDAPPVEVNGYYYDNYTFKTNYEIELIDKNTIQLNFVKNRNNCPSIIFHKK